MYRPNIDKDELKKLPLGGFSGEIHLIDTMAGLRKYLPALMKEEILGFDTETQNYTCHFVQALALDPKSTDILLKIKKIFSFERLHFLQVKYVIMHCGTNLPYIGVFKQPDEFIR